PVEGEDMSRLRVIPDGVRIHFGRDGPGGLQRLQVEDGDVVAAAVADEALVELRRDGDAVNARGIRNVADDRVLVDVDDDDVGGVGDVEPPRRRVHRQVVPAAFSADFDLVQDVVTGRRGDGHESESE